MSADTQQEHKPPEKVVELNQAGMLLASRPTSFPRSIFSLSQEHIERMKLLARMVSTSQLSYAKNGRQALSEGDVFIIMLKGIEVGLEPMAALDLIDIIQGKPALKPQGMLAVAYNSGKIKSISIEGDDKACTVTIIRTDQELPVSQTFSIEDAKRFQTTEWVNNEKKTIPLADKFNWQSQPANMLKWRAVAAACRVALPDAIQGMYTPEELAPDSLVNEDGEIIDLPQQNVSGSTRTTTEQGGSKKTDGAGQKADPATQPVETPAQSIVRQIRAKINGITDDEIREFGDVQDMFDKDQWKKSFPDAKSSLEVVTQFVEVYNLGNGIIDEGEADDDPNDSPWSAVDTHFMSELATEVYCLGEEADVLKDLGKEKWSDFASVTAARNALRNKAIQEKSRIVLATQLRYKKLNAKSNYVEMYADDLTFRIYSRQMLRDLGIEGWGEGESPDNWEPHATKKRFLPKGYELEIPEGKWEPAKTGEHFEIKEIKIAF